MPNAQYRFFGAPRNNFKYDVIAFLVVFGVILLLVMVILLDFRLFWVQELLHEQGDTTVDP